ncbi:hypothetical protein HYW18_00155 [Candidatus Uhrbacteria bacterium]|nr:hypothetical protein [Candidatus Uhrbacteria bacterium]
MSDSTRSPRPSFRELAETARKLVMCSDSLHMTRIEGLLRRFAAANGGGAEMTTWSPLQILNESIEHFRQVNPSLAARLCERVAEEHAQVDAEIKAAAERLESEAHRKKIVEEKIAAAGDDRMEQLRITYCTRVARDGESLEQVFGRSFENMEALLRSRKRDALRALRENPCRENAQWVEETDRRLEIFLADKSETEATVKGMAPMVTKTAESASPVAQDENNGRRRNRRHGHKKPEAAVAPVASDPDRQPIGLDHLVTSLVLH